MSVAQLIAAIEADPDDAEARAVYADYLLETGDALGTLMTTEDELEFQALADDYFEEHFPMIGSSMVEWRNGLIHRLELSTHLGVEVVTAIAATPAARFIRELELWVQPRRRRTPDWDEDEIPDSPQPDDFPRDPIPTLLQYPLPKTLRKLDLSLFLRQADRSVAPNRAYLLYPQLQNLEELCLQETEGLLHTMDLPKLRALSLNIFEEATLRELAHAKLPELRTLRLAYARGDWVAEALRAVTPAFPKLEEVLVDEEE